MANESSVIQEIGRILSNRDAEVRKPLVEALGCAEYALTHPESDQQFALAAVRGAIGKADAAITQAKASPSV